jgi:hypothetical protein
MLRVGIGSYDVLFYFENSVLHLLRSTLITNLSDNAMLS